MSKARTFPVKTGVVREKRKNGDIYVFERQTLYDPEKRYCKVLSKKLIGKIVKGTEEMVPTRPKKKSDPQKRTNTKKTPINKQRVGMINIIRHVSKKSGVTKEIMDNQYLDEGIKQKLLTLVWYGLATDGESWTGAYNWCTKYLKLLPYPHNPISEDMYHDLFLNLGKAENVKQSIFQDRAKRMGKGELLALDSTTLECNAKEVKSARKSIHKDKTIKKVYKLVQIYSITSKQLVAYAIVPGNIPDGSTVENALKQLKSLELSKAEIVADEGYASADNLSMMIGKNFDFITHISSRSKWIQPLIAANKSALELGSSFITCDPKYAGVTVKHEYEYKDGDEEKTKSLYVHIYYNSTKKAEEEVKFREKFINLKEDILTHTYLSPEDRRFKERYMIEKLDENNEVRIELNKAEYVKQSKFFGYVVLVASKENNTNTALEKYRSREEIEESFKIYKSHTGGNVARKWSDETLEGQVLVNFLIQSLVESFGSMVRTVKDSIAKPTGDAEHDMVENLKEEKQLKCWLRKTSLHNILGYFDAIEIASIRESNPVTITTETTKRDRLFLKKLGIELNSP